MLTTEEEEEELILITLVRCDWNGKFNREEEFSLLIDGWTEEQ